MNFFTMIWSNHVVAARASPGGCSGRAVPKDPRLTFASRPKSQFPEFIFYGTGGMVTTEYGPYCRNMRKLCILQLLSTSKVQSSSPLRPKELGLVVTSLRKKGTAREVVDVSEVMTKLVEDMTYMMVSGA